MCHQANSSIQVCAVVAIFHHSLTYSWKANLSISLWPDPVCGLKNPSHKAFPFSGGLMTTSYVSDSVCQHSALIVFPGWNISTSLHSHVLLSSLSRAWDAVMDRGAILSWMSQHLPKSLSEFLVSKMSKECPVHSKCFIKTSGLKIKNIKKHNIVFKTW